MKNNLEQRREINQSWCALILLICWALIAVAIGVSLTITMIRSMLEHLPSADAELTALYPEPICEFCGTILDGREHRCDEPVSTASTN